MNLVKWIRKNERKLMAVVVILIMVAFVGGSGLRWLLNRSKGGNMTIATYGDGDKLTPRQRSFARQELEVLAGLTAKDYLYSSLMGNRPKIKDILLGQLLFPNTQISTMVADKLKSASLQGHLHVSDEAIESFFKELHGINDIYWILLKAEAKQAGCVVKPEEAKGVLKQIIPALSGGNYDAKDVVDSMIKRYNMTETELVSVFAKLLGVITYTENILSSEDVTTNQLRSLIGRMQEKIGAEYVAFDSANYLDKQPDPTSEQIAKQFEQYKDFAAGEYNDENPYGLGYQLPARVQLEYLVVKVDDVRKTVEAPLAEEMERYYQRNLSRFTEDVKTDPADPESETTKRQKSYVEVANEIQNRLIDRNTSSKVDMIMNEAVVQTEAGLTNEDFENLDSEQIKGKIADFGKASELLSKKFGVTVHSGKTGYLSPKQFSRERYLGRLAMTGSNQRLLELGKAVFAIEELGVTKLSQFDGQVPQMWENIGPMKGMYGRIAALVRVVDTKKPETAAASNTSYSIAGLAIDDDSKEAIYSVKDAVAADVKLLAAGAVAKAKAQALVKSAGDKGWEAAITAYNESLEKPSDPNLPLIGKIKLDKLAETPLISKDQLASFKKTMEENPAAATYLEGILTSNMLAEQLRSMLEKGVNAKLGINTVIEFKPKKSSYAIKDIIVTSATKQEYTKTKGNFAGYLDMISSDSLAVVHYNAANLQKRMNFEFVERDEDKPAEPETEESQEDVDVEK